MKQKVIPLCKIGNTDFGEMLDYEFDSNKYTSVILCYNEGYGLRTVGYVSLPHQLYLEKLEEILVEHPHIKEFVAIPVNNKDHITIAEVKYEENNEHNKNK